MSHPQQSQDLSGGENGHDAAAKTLLVDVENGSDRFSYLSDVGEVGEHIEV